MKGIDVSEHNDFIDWLAVKHAGIDFAICRTGFGKGGFDPFFARNVLDAHDAGLICGAYHYSTAMHNAQLITHSRIAHCALNLDAIKPLDYGVYASLLA
ncbi:MAG: hypothetical protein IJG33_05990 [Selenomonadaceae bacterium]|nr:hypothetical protein [Selenomonadaceae bacterium]